VTRIDISIDSSRIVHLVLLIVYANSIWYSIENGLAHGTDGLGGNLKAQARLHAPGPRPEVAPARFGVRFPSHWCHGIVRHLEGCVVSHRSIRESTARFKPVDTRAVAREVAQAALPV
jgi:hypothetical protein